MAQEKRNRRGDQDVELELQEMEASPPNKVHQLVTDLDQLTADLADLPLSAQLAVVRVVTPAVLEKVAPSARAAVIKGMKRPPARH